MAATNTQNRQEQVTAFRTACKEGQLARAKELRARHNFTRKEAFAYEVEIGPLGYDIKDRAKVESAPIIAALRGHFGVVKWLASAFCAGPESDFFSEVFRGACDGNHLDIARWSAEAMGWSTEDDYRDLGYDALMTVCKLDNLEFARFLVEQFKLGKSEIIEEHAALTALKRNNIALAEYLIKAGGLSKGEVFGKKLQNLAGTGKRLTLATLRWAFARLGVTAADVDQSRLLEDFDRKDKLLAECSGAVPR
jgi:hypothetical protein